MIDIVSNTAELDEKITIQQEEVNMIVDRVNTIVRENASTAQSQEEYQKRYDGLSKRFEEENSKLNDLLKEKDKRMHQRKKWSHS